MANHYTQIMSHRIYFILFIFFYAKCGLVFGKLATEKSSLAFVIDNTGSMWNDIQEVKSAAKSIFNAVKNSNASHIGDFILVTFNDPDIKSAFITTNDAVYMAALDSIIVDGGGDCPEMAMKGIEEALIKSHPRSYIFVFTDASAKDYADYSRVKSIAQKKLSQIVFVLTGICETEVDPAYVVYHQLAKATTGQVFHLEKAEVNKVLKYVAEIVKSPRAILGEWEFGPGYDKTLNYTTDSKTKDVILAVTGKHPKIEVVETNGTIATSSKIFETDKALVVKVTDTEPGTHTAKVGSESKTKAVITGATTFNFKHGFSVLKPHMIEDTVTRPISGKLLYLAIETDNPDNDVELKEVNLLDTSSNILQVLPLDKIDKDFYLTEQAIAPNTMFKILVKGFMKTTKKPIERLSTTPIEPQILMDEGPPTVKTPTITSVGEALKKINYGDPLELRCRVNGFPKPRITWVDEKSERIISEMVEDVDLPYDYVSLLSIGQFKTNASYECRASNDYGEDRRAVTVEAITKFDVVKISEDTGIPYGDEGTLNCLIDANPPSEVTWYINGAPIGHYENIEISSGGSVLTIMSMQPRYEGKYTCEVRNELKRQHYSMQVTMPDKALPKIGNTAAEVKVRRNRNVDISCEVIQGVPQPRMRWFFKQQNTSDFVEISEITDVLHITTADLDSAGIYRCEAINDYGKDTKTKVLTVEYPPTIKDDKKLIIIEHGKNVYLHCEVDGFPPPSVDWRFNGDIVENSFTNKIFTNNTLRLTAAMSKSGNYTCEAGNELGSVERTVQVFVYDPPKVKVPEETNIKKPVGNSITLQCKASGFPKPTVTWLFFNKDARKKLRPSDSSGSLHLPRLQASDRGYYVCLARNFGGSANLTYLVDVLVPPIIKKSPTRRSLTAIIYDLVLELPCQAFGNPKPTVTWMKNGLNLSTGTQWYDITNNGTLIIKNIDDTSNGTYVCVARNEAGSDVDLIHVNVLQFPRPGIPEKSINLELGKSAKIDCDIPHRPIDVLRWYKDSKIIATGELTLKNVQMSDQGLYTCRVNSFSGGISATVAVKVGFKPMFLFEENEDVDFYLDEQAYLSCAARGNPYPKVSWEHNDKILNVTGMIHVFTMLESNMGRYTCVVSNKFGTISRNFNIANTDCLLKQSEKSDSPTLTYYDLRLDTATKVIQVPKGETVTFTCPGEFIGFPGNNIEATCVQDTTVKINERLFNASEIKCDIDSIRPVIKNLNFPCGPGSTEKLKVGYENGGKFVETYEICYDMSKAVPVYSSHRIRRSLSGKEPYNVTKWFDNDFVPYNYDDLYNCDNQIENLSMYLRRKPSMIVDNCCFARKQLVNPRDVFPGLSQMATYSNLNVVPQWSTCSSQNWDEVEKRVRSLSEQADQELVVHTGTAEGPFRFRPIFLTDKNHKRQRAPEFLWKVVQDELSESSLAIIQVNVPYLTPSQATSYIRCKDICWDIEWMKNPVWRNVYKGFTYCCAVEDFEKAFGFPKIFSPRMQNIFSDISVVPDHSLT